jgi:3-methyladenine DNA glycosylase/8-oxoguanine DNA glycosylase
MRATKTWRGAHWTRCSGWASTSRRSRPWPGQTPWSDHWPSACAGSSLRAFRPCSRALVNGVACQQLSLTVGIHLLNRLTAAHGRAAANGPPDARAFPDPVALASLQPEELKRHGFSTTKAHTIIEIARAITAGDLDLEALHALDDDAAVERLIGLHGIGRWTAEYVLLRGLGRLHVFPGDDVGAQSKLKRLLGIDTPLGYDDVGTLVARWQPFAGVVYFHLLLDSLTRPADGPPLVGAGKSSAQADAV